MKSIFTSVFMAVLVCFVGFAQNDSEQIRYITMKDGQMVAIPEKYIVEEIVENGVCILSLVGGTEYVYSLSNVESVDNSYYGDKAGLLSFAFTHADNDQVYKDVVATITETDDTVYVTADVPVIGKRLRPSFALTSGATMWLGDVQQVSSQSSARFTAPVVYTMALPGQWIYDATLVQDEPEGSQPPVDEEDEWVRTRMDIASLATTNAPSNYTSQEFANLFDNDNVSHFHSTWGSGAYEKLNWTDGGYYGDGYTQWPYIEVELPEKLENFCISYTTSNQSNRFPQGLLISARNSVTGNWDIIAELAYPADALPQVNMQEFMSPVYDLGTNYTAVRVELTKASHKNYMVMSEFALYACEKNGDEDTESLPKPGDDPTYITGFKPYGRPCKVSVGYLTDYATGEYKIPTIYLTFGDGVTWDSSQWIGQTIYNEDGTSYNTKEEWIKDCTFRLDGAGVWPDIDIVEGCEIRGRGNSSWSSSYMSKNPYRVKFPKKAKQSPFNLTTDRQWVFIANKQNGSMTTNSIAQKIAAMVDAEALCHMIPVDLYINGHYRGSYCFTEKIGIADNSVAIDESVGCLLELDSYYDENFKFKDTYYNLPVNVKDPDFSEEDEERIVTFDAIRNNFNSMTSVLSSGGDITTAIDMESWARFWLVNDLVRNVETYHPKSCYIFNEDVVNGALWKFGPAWDFDWAFGYEESSQYFTVGATEDIYSRRNSHVGYRFFNAIRKTEAGKRAYYKEWVNFMAEGRLQELLEYVDDYTAFVLASIRHNNDANVSEKNSCDYLTVAENSKQWLEKRANYIFSSLEAYDIEPDVVSPEDFGKPMETLLIIDELHADFAPKAGKYASVVYVRDIEAGKYGTIVLPFVPDTATLENYAFYALVGSGDGYVDFEEETEPAANTPYLFALREGKENVPMSGGETVIDRVAKTVSVGDWDFVGSFTNHDIDTSTGNYYAYSSVNNEVNRITEQHAVLPYRAYFNVKDETNSSLRVYINGTTGVVEIAATDIEGLGDGIVYDVYGRRVIKPVKGCIYIKDGKKIVF